MIWVHTLLCCARNFLTAVVVARWRTQAPSVRIAVCSYLQHKTGPVLVESHGIKATTTHPQKKQLQTSDFGTYEVAPRMNCFLLYRCALWCVSHACACACACAFDPSVCPHVDDALFCCSRLRGTQLAASGGPAPPYLPAPSTAPTPTPTTTPTPTPVPPPPPLVQQPLPAAIEDHGENRWHSKRHQSTAVGEENTEPPTHDRPRHPPAPIAAPTKVGWAGPGCLK